MDKVTLSQTERLTLINQLSILEVLYPGEAKAYAEKREALEMGYTREYSSLFEHLCEEMPPAECDEVLAILDMYRDITFSVDALPKGHALPNSGMFPFPGFDGNNETRQYGFCRYYIETLGRYHELSGRSLNSHMGLLPRYRQMLKIWKPMQDARIAQVSASNLTEQQLAQIFA